MRLVAFWIAVVVLVAACEGKDKDKDNDKDEEKDATASAVASGTASPATCPAACEHRKSCGVAGDIAACTKDCEGLAELLGANAPKELEAYLAADCAAVKQAEAGFVQASTCIRGCKHVIACGVVGTYPACFVECGTNLEKQAYTVADLEKVIASDCETVKNTIVLTPPSPAPTADWREAEAEALFRRNPRFPMCNDHNDCGGSTPVCCRQQFHSSCVSACM
jgi:hypothetical protein